MLNKSSCTLRPPLELHDEVRVRSSFLARALASDVEHSGVTWGKSRYGSGSGSFDNIYVIQN